MTGRSRSLTLPYVSDSVVPDQEFRLSRIRPYAALGLLGSLDFDLPKTSRVRDALHRRLTAAVAPSTLDRVAQLQDSRHLLAGGGEVSAVEIAREFIEHPFRPQFGCFTRDESFFSRVVRGCASGEEQHCGSERQRRPPPRLGDPPRHRQRD